MGIVFVIGAALLIGMEYKSIYLGMGVLLLFLPIVALLESVCLELGGIKKVLLVKKETN